MVINADDYYGKEAFRSIHAYMTETMDTESDVYDMCMAGFILSNTLSENGSVTRGICRLGEDGSLKQVTETYDIEQKEHGIAAKDEKGNPCVSPCRSACINEYVGSASGLLEDCWSGGFRFF